MAREKRPYELLVRWGEDGTIQGSHYVEADVVTDDVTGDVLSYAPGNPAPIDPATVAGVLGATSAAQVAQIASLEARLAALASEHDQLKSEFDPPIMVRVGKIARWMDANGKGNAALNWLRNNPDIDELNVKAQAFVNAMTALGLDPTELYGND